MNAIRTISRVLVVTAVAFVGSASAGDKGKGKVDECAQFKTVARVVMPVLTKEILKHQNPYLSAFVEAGVATAVNGHIPAKDRVEAEGLSSCQGAAKYFAANVSSRELAVVIAANTRFNKKDFEEGCDEYIGAVPYIGTPVSKTIKKITPSIIETTHNSIASSLKAGRPTLEISFTL